ncbi:MAG TPA: ATP-binding protein [Cyanophyceae cyanobacterium]
MSERIFEQQLTLSFQRLEDLWQRAENLPTLSEELSKPLKEASIQHRQLLKESLDEFSNSLEELQTITEELRQQNEALAASHAIIETERQRYRELFELAPTGYLITTKESAILEVNRMAAQLLSAFPQHLHHKPLAVFVNAEKRQEFYAKLRKLQAGKSIKNWQFQIQTRHGACIPICCTVMPIRNAQGQVVELCWWMQDLSCSQAVETDDIPFAQQHPVTSLKDPNLPSNQDIQTSFQGTIEHLAPAVTTTQDSNKHKQLPTAVPEAFIKDEEFSAIKFHFMSRAAYELRNPLNTIASCAKLLESYGQQWSDEKKLSYFQRIQLNVKRIERLLDDFLLMGKIETGQLQLKPALVDLTEFCHQLIQELKRDVGCDRKIILTYKSQISGVWDKKILRQILLNLLSNAIKYSPKGSEIQLDIDGRDGYIKLCIQSSGISIPHNDSHFLFKPLYPSSHVGVIEEQGLGFAIVKKCVDLQGGDVWIENQEGTGTTFTVKLPLVLQQRNSRMSEN